MCHWESSRRSLYVKTVWTNGHHHAILTPEDPLLKTAQKLEQRKSYSVISRHRSAKTAQTLLPTPPPRAREHGSGGDLSVSSVQIFLEGLQKKRARSKRQSAVSMYQIRERERDKFILPSKTAPTIAVVPMDRLKMRNINDEIEFFGNDKRKNRRSNSYDVGMSSSTVREGKSWMEPYVSGLTNAGQNTGTVLSERVMLWLDLARQSQEGRIKKFEEDKIREELERKQIKKSLTTSPNWIPYVDYENAVDGSVQGEVNAATNCKSNRDDLHLNDLSILKSSPMKLTQSAVVPETVSEAQRKTEKASEGKRNDNNVPVISSKLENSDDVPSVPVPSENERSEGVFPVKYSGSSFSKRQLHIFMPNVPKRKVDNENRSILSDISSRYGTRVKFTV